MQTTGDNSSQEWNGCGSGLVVCVDIVGFSRLASVRQSSLITDLKRSVVDPTLKDARSAGRVIILPTGDGLLAFFPVLNDTDEGELFRIHLCFLATLIHWAENPSGDHRPCLLRIGLHFGPVSLIQDFNDQLNVIGDTVNMTQRTMNAADAGQMLLHQNYISQYLGEETKRMVSTPLPYCSPKQPVPLILETDREVGISVKHGVSIVVRPARLLVGDRLFRDHKNLSEPESAKHMVVAITPQGKPVTPPQRQDKPGKGSEPSGKSFAERLLRAHSVALIQLTGCRMIGRLENQGTRLPDGLRKLWVLMPHADQVAHFQGEEAKRRVDKLPEHIDRWRTWLAQWQENHPDCDVRLKLFKNPPYFGASLIDWDQPGGVIHVSPYVWGMAANKCPGYDLEWAGKFSSSTYQAYVEGLRNLIEPRESCEKLGG
ncbi:MAG: adenylate/guanylate cyclase domain-containing protein [Magnetococcales bacterium]|nr:adenylate/guanylate cyclase domain-containing protein [Magnetococcales bacterium]